MSCVGTQYIRQGVINVREKSACHSSEDLKGANVVDEASGEIGAAGWESEGLDI